MKPVAAPVDAFSSIRAEGAALDAPTVGPDAGQLPADGSPVATEEAEAKEWAEFPALFGAIICQAMPELRESYSESNCAEWGRRMVPVARKYGWTTKAFGGWIGLLSATWIFAKPTFDAVRARRAAPPKPAPDAAKPETEAPAAPAQ